MQFRFQKFGGLPDIFLLLISDLIILWSEKIHYLNPLKFTETCFMVHSGSILVNVTCELDAVGVFY